MKEFGDKIIDWYLLNKRELPWRNTKNPYYIWLSEVILQQTRVEQGLPYYIKFIEKFPKIEDLAKSDQNEVLRLWQGLGYYARGRNLHHTANLVMNEFDGIFPTKFDHLIQLKGIGNYTAAAISSFCTNEAKAVVDGNVYRVLARYFGLQSDISLLKTQKEFQSLANELLNKKRAGLYNQAIMEFGALQCVPKNPLCNICPLNDSCAAFAQNKVFQLPVKSKKLKIKTRYFIYLVITDGIHVSIHKRTAGDIWEGLYEFPLIESEQDLDEISILNSAAFKKVVRNSNYQILSISNVFRHKLTHQTINCKFKKIKIAQFTNKSNFEIVSWNSFETYPKPIIIQRFYINNKL